MRRIIALVLLLFAAPAAAQEIKLATWNIAWLTLRPAGDAALPRDLPVRAPGDFALLRAYADRLAADVIALQEIDGEAAAARVFDPARYAIHLTDENDVQRPGFAVRRGLRFTPNPDLAALDLRAGARFSLRRGADITVHGASGATLRLLSVHLNAGCREDPLEESRERDCESLARQAEIVAGWIAAREREGAAYVVLGDFNRRIQPDDDFLRRLTRAAPLTRPTEGVSSPCWANARGGWPFISHLLAGGPARGWVQPRSLTVLTYTETARSYRQRLSDHCPISIRMTLP